MSKYIKLFNKHTDYNTYINDNDKELPNTSYCIDNNDVHYNGSGNIIAEFNVHNAIDPSTLITETILYFDEFPQDIADDEYDGDMDAFRQTGIDAIDDNPQNCNGYRYLNQTFEIDGIEYYLWEKVEVESCQNIKYIVTDTLDFTGLSLEDDITNNYCPFVYMLTEDKEISYDNTEHSDYILVAARNDVNYGSNIYC